MLEGGKPPQTMLIISRNALTVGVFLFPGFFSWGLWMIFEHLPHLATTLFQNNFRSSSAGSCGPGDCETSE